MPKALTARSAFRMAHKIQPKMLYFNPAGLGDDLMVFWAFLAGRSAGILPPELRLDFHQAESREYLRSHAERAGCVSAFDLPAGAPVTYVREGIQPLWKSSKLAMIFARLGNRRKLCAPYYHKQRTEHRPKELDWDAPTRFAIRIGLLRVWDTPYEAIFDGWQELSMACGFSYQEAEETAPLLGGQWEVLRQRLTRQNSSGLKAAYLFPGGGSFQDFDQAFVDFLLTVFPDLSVARHQSDLRPADIRFKNLGEAEKLIAEARYVVTTDSVCSHLAQFFARKHLLICSRSRPGNVCFPGAQNTRIVDLGEPLDCRPCPYYRLESRSTCAEGYSRCRPLVEISQQTKATLSSCLDWIERAA